MFCTEQFMQAVYADCIIEVQGWVNVRPYMPLTQSAYRTFTACMARQHILALQWYSPHKLLA